MPSNPFAYREPLNDADLDRHEDWTESSDGFLLHHGLITKERIEESRRWRDAHREEKKAKDRELEQYLDQYYDWVYDGCPSSDEETPMTPPRSPRRNSDGPDLSRKAWEKDVELLKVRWWRGKPEDFGFDKYETWREYQIKHAQSQPSALNFEATLCNTLPIQPQLPVANNDSLQVLRLSQPQYARSLRSPGKTVEDTHVGRKYSKRGSLEKHTPRVTRSRARMSPSIFYELARDGKTKRERPASSRARHTTEAGKSARSLYRIEKQRSCR